MAHDAPVTPALRAAPRAFDRTIARAQQLVFLAPSRPEPAVNVL
jgi:hypothetical protein